MKRIIPLLLAGAFILPACSSDAEDIKKESAAPVAALEQTEEKSSTVDSLVSWGKDAMATGEKLKDSVAREVEALSLTRMAEDFSSLGDSLKGEVTESALKEAKQAVAKAEETLKELEESAGVGSEDIVALIDTTKSTLTVTSKLLADPESRDDMVEIVRNLYQVSKNLKKLSSMVQTSPVKFAWNNLPGAINYLRHNDFSAIRTDVDSLVTKLENSSETGLSLTEIQDLQGLVDFMTVLARNLDDNLNSAAGQEFSEKFKPGIQDLRENLEKAQPLLDNPEENSAVIVKHLKEASRCLKDLSELTLEFPEYLKLWPKP